jgi:hypothetical protein
MYLQQDEQQARANKKNQLKIDWQEVHLKQDAQSNIDMSTWSKMCWQGA